MSSCTLSGLGEIPAGVPAGGRSKLKAVTVAAQRERTTDPVGTQARATAPASSTNVAGGGGDSAPSPPSPPRLMARSRWPADHDVSRRSSSISARQLPPILTPRTVEPALDRAVMSPSTFPAPGHPPAGVTKPYRAPVGAERLHDRQPDRAPTLWRREGPRWWRGPSVRTRRIPRPPGVHRQRTPCPPPSDIPKTTDVS